MNSESRFALEANANAMHSHIPHPAWLKNFVQSFVLPWAFLSVSKSSYIFVISRWEIFFWETRYMPNLWLFSTFFGPFTTNIMSKVLHLIFVTNFCTLNTSSQKSFWKSIKWAVLTFVQLDSYTESTFYRLINKNEWVQLKGKTLLYKIL